MPDKIGAVWPPFTATINTRSSQCATRQQHSMRSLSADSATKSPSTPIRTIESVASACSISSLFVWQPNSPPSPKLWPEYDERSFLLSDFKLRSNRTTRLLHCSTLLPFDLSWYRSAALATSNSKLLRGFCSRKTGSKFVLIYRWDIFRHICYKAGRGSLPPNLKKCQRLCVHGETQIISA
jgi:hypothetical protein